MPLLLVFALLAGAGTAISPCVLPVLPALLSASATGGRRRPLGIIAGLTATFVLTIAALASVIHGVGLADGATRWLAVVVLAVFGVALAVPAVGDRVEARMSRLARLGPRSAGDGFWSGVLVGAALGFVYAPCAGPILAAVISVSATEGTSARIVAVAIAYGLGSAAVLLLLAYGGRRVLERVRRAGRGPALQRAIGAVMVLTAVAMAANLDVRFQTALANDFPSFLANPTGSLERSDAVERRLAGLRPGAKFDSGGRAPVAHAGTDPAAAYRRLGPAPGFVGNQRWFNTPGGRPLTLSGLRGRVVLIDFWTYTCINCLRTLPYVKAWDARYRRDGLTVVGVHTPEFSFEHDAGNVRRAIAQNGIRYPVAQDNDYATWNAWGNQYWPAKYLIDAKGQVRYTHFGEGGYDKTERAIRALLAEDGSRRLGARVHPHAEAPSKSLQTPETYLGAEHGGQGFAGDPPRKGTRRYRGAGELGNSRFALRGTWKVGREAATAVGGASLDASFTARKVFLVLSSRGNAARPVRVSVDGKPAGAGSAGSDVHGGRATVREQRLYRLVELPRVGRHRLELRFAPGVSGYAFTFG